MIIDGRKIANTIYEQLARAIAALPRSPRVDIVIVGNNPVIESFVGIKKRAAARLNIAMIVHRFPETISEELLKQEIARIAQMKDSDAVIVQLPLPQHMNAQALLDVIPFEKDVDMLSTLAIAQFANEQSKIIPPVAGAIKEILDEAHVSVHGDEVLVLGFGRLVGKPVSILLRHNGAHVTVIDKPVADLSRHVRESLVVISGVGSPNLITPAMITSAHDFENGKCDETIKAVHANDSS